jgi:hypothetical protein
MGRKDLKILILLLALQLSACVKDKPTEISHHSTSTGNVYIVCEGNLGSGNGSLYAYSTTTNEVSGDLYKSANSGSLGDVFQSMIRMGDGLYLCINNSDKIVVLNAITHKEAGTISIPKPRYILPVSRNKAYVSSLYNNRIYTIDPQTLQTTGHEQIPFNNTEGMCQKGGALYICPWDTACNKIYTTNALWGGTPTPIQIAGYAPHAVLEDKEQMLWVLSGNVVKGCTPALTRINPSTGHILSSFNFTAGSDPIKPTFNPTKDTLYFIQVKYDGSTADNGIYRMAINAAALPETPFIQASQYQYFWALGIDPGTGNIYVGDPKGFLQKGDVTIYRPDGMQITSFKVGLGPGQFYFTE